jgi:hypothetical protein
MTTRPVECVAEESLGEVLSLPEADPRRAHLDNCPRCRALVVGYRQFLEPAPAAAHSYGTAEETHLTAFRERLAGGAAGSAAAAAAAAAAPVGAVDTSAETRMRETGGASWWSRIFAPSMRPAWGLVAVAVLFGGLWLGPKMRPQETEPVLRGGTTAALAIGEEVILPDGGLRLSWQPHPEAEHYELRFYSTALAEISRRDVGTGPAATIAPADMPEAYRVGEVVLYRVVALKGGDDLESSAPGSLQRP